MSSMILRDGDSNRFLGCVETSIGLGLFGVTTDAMGYVTLTSLRLDSLLLAVIGPIKEEKWFLDRLKMCKSPVEYEDELQKIVQTVAKPVGDNSSIEMGPLMCDAMARVGYDKIVHVEDNFEKVTLGAKDSAGRCHEYTVRFAPNSVVQRPDLETTLPMPVQFSWRGDRLRAPLDDIVRAVESSITKFEPFFQVADDISRRCRIMEPLNPTYGTCVRRLALDQACSVTVSINPLNPTALCDMTFMGPASTTAQLRQAVSANAFKWSEDEPFVTNLEAVLGVSLLPPLRGDEGTSTTEGNECGICYSIESPDDSEGGGNKHPNGSGPLPTDVICSNEHCARLYHRSCLVGWLQAVPSSRTSFGTIFGACPYCSESISVRAMR